MKNYWDDLNGPKYAVQIPNAGHSLKGGREKAMRTIGVFARCVASDRKLPRITWDFQGSNDQCSIVVKCQQKPTAVKIWRADSKDLDFRDEEWSSTSLTGDGTWEYGLKSDQHTAMFAELEFQIDRIPYSLCTLIYRR